MTDEEYRKLQEFLAVHPDTGDLIKETGGLRKVRWSVGSKGKSGGVRVIYYHAVTESQIRMLLIYKKGVQDDLTPSQRATLRKINERWK